MKVCLCCVVGILYLFVPLSEMLELDELISVMLRLATKLLYLEKLKFDREMMYLFSIPFVKSNY